MTKHDLQARILTNPMCHSWDYPSEWGGGVGSVSEKPILDVSDLDNKWKVLACIMAYNNIDVLPRYRTLERCLELSKSELKKIVAELKKSGRVTTMPTFSERTGLISGSGFYAE